MSSASSVCRCDVMQARQKKCGGVAPPAARHAHPWWIPRTLFFQTPRPLSSLLPAATATRGRALPQQPTQRVRARCAAQAATLRCGARAPVVDTWWPQRRPAAPRVRSCSCGHASADERAACCALQLTRGARSVAARVSEHANAADAHAPSRHGRRGASGEPLRAIAPAASCRLSVRVALTPPCKRRSLASAGRSG